MFIEHWYAKQNFKYFIHIILFNLPKPYNVDIIPILQMQKIRHKVFATGGKPLSYLESQNLNQ